MGDVESAGGGQIIYLWSDDLGRAYAAMSQVGSAWRVEWGYREPTGSSEGTAQGWLVSRGQRVQA